ncbi:hypothetical protein LWI29_023235 [Acer saccharum]|uniref:RRM domain-containing protein n=1 Tax=Acer saccharum TaxID=4024 RepID=A0AA39W3I5_ACESA|nr:hypothetical protein LWI29_023235 [Acer saccharum]
MRGTLRENAREGAGRANGGGGQKDFRDNLVSVFVDNLSHEVDVAGIWGIFKPFGKLRDVFLSPKSSARRSLYAFLRFSTREEALKVAKMVNGMHVYARPIQAKIVDYGWSNRRQTEIRPGLRSGELGWNGDKERVDLQTC